jgi:hypothetical protein
MRHVDVRKGIGREFHLLTMATPPLKEARVCLQWRVNDREKIGHWAYHRRS